MKFYVVVTYYLVSLSFKFHEDLCTNARARVVNGHVRVLSRIRDPVDELQLSFETFPGGVVGVQHYLKYAR